MPNTTERKPKVVVDTSVIVAGLLSPIGGSNKVLTACKSGILVCAISTSTRDEIQRNLTKFPKKFLEDFELLIASYFQEINPDKNTVDQFTRFVDPDDAHLLAACSIWNADYLLSLNHKHLLGNQTAQSAIKAKIVSPKELIAIFGL